MKYQSDLNLAKENNKIYAKVLMKLKKKRAKNLDTEFEELHDKAFSKIDCLSCANCCKTTSPIFRDIDIKRISKHLRINEIQFISNYLRMDEDRDYVLKTSPCHFLGSDNACDIYDVRPLACREYPHTNRKNMFQIMELTIKNTEICPAVAQIVEQLTVRHS